MAASLSLVGGTLWQWEADRQVSVRGWREGDVAEFATAGGCPGRLGLVVATRSAGKGEGTAPVPNQLMESGDDLMCWLIRGERVEASLLLRVLRRARPADYVSEQTDVLTYQGLKEWVEDAIKGVTFDPSEVNEAIADARAASREAREAGREAVGRATRISSGDGPAQAPPGKLGDQYVDTSTGDWYEYAQV